MVLNGMERRGEKTSGYKSRLEAARARLDYLEKARGVHNMAASQAVFKKSGEELSTLLEELTRLNSSKTAAKE
jgi:hypothetical protein